MNRIRYAALACTVLALTLVPLAAVAQEDKETPAETITRLKQEAAVLRMELSHAKLAAVQGKAAQADARAKTQTAAAQRAELQKQIADLQASVKALTTQNEQLQALLKTDAAQAADQKVRDALGQLVQALKANAETKTANTKLVARINDLEARVKRTEKLATMTRRELATTTAALADARQELAIEKGKRIAPPVTVKPAKPVVTTPRPRPRPKPKVRINTTIRAVRDDLASIAVGSESGVADGMRLIVSRGSDYVATLVISQVEKRQAAGELVDVKMPVKPGDEVNSTP